MSGSTDAARRDEAERVQSAFAEGARLRIAFAEQASERIVAAARTVAGCFERGGKLLLFGNGGSASDAQHIAAEFVNRFVEERRALPALALTTDTSALTSIANDRSYDEVFSRQVEAWGRTGDVAIAISTSGNSPSVLRAVEVCKARGITTIGLTGGGGGQLAPRVDLSIDVAGTRNTARIQEIHITVGHVLCELVDAALVGAR